MDFGSWSAWKDGLFQGICSCGGTNPAVGGSLGKEAGGRKTQQRPLEATSWSSLDRPQMGQLRSEWSVLEAKWMGEWAKLGKEWGNEGNWAIKSQTRKGQCLWTAEIQLDTPSDRGARCRGQMAFAGTKKLGPPRPWSSHPISFPTAKRSKCKHSTTLGRMGGTQRMEQSIQICGVPLCFCCKGD
jgi:hypothetical protein